MTEEDPLVSAVEKTVAYARTAEKLIAAITQLGPVADSLTALLDLAPELAPELRTVAQNLTEAGDALVRAADFADAKYHVDLTNLRTLLDIPTPDEGGTA